MSDEIFPLIIIGGVAFYIYYETKSVSSPIKTVPPKGKPKSKPKIVSSPVKTVPVKSKPKIVSSPLKLGPSNEKPPSNHDPPHKYKPPRIIPWHVGLTPLSPGNNLKTLPFYENPPKMPPPIITDPPLTKDPLQDPFVPLHIPGSWKPLQVPGSLKPVQIPGTEKPLQIPGSFKHTLIPGTFKHTTLPGKLQPLGPDQNNQACETVAENALFYTSQGWVPAFNYLNAQQTKNGLLMESIPPICSYDNLAIFWLVYYGYHNQHDANACWIAYKGALNSTYFPDTPSTRKSMSYYFLMQYNHSPSMWPNKLTPENLNEVKNFGK